MHGGQPFLLNVCRVLRQSFEESLGYQLHIFYCPSHVGHLLVAPRKPFPDILAYARTAATDDMKHQWAECAREP